MTPYYGKKSDIQKEKFKKSLEATGKLHLLFSDSETVSCNSRVIENLICSIFNTVNLGRNDDGIDTKENNLGVGIKTFTLTKVPSDIKPQKTYQKIAEFNKDAPTIAELSDSKERAILISKLRNNRSEKCVNQYQVNEFIYLLIMRYGKDIYISEYAYDWIDIENIRVIKSTKSSLFFTDGKHEYKYTYSKSTLMKAFYIRGKDIIETIKIDKFLSPEEILARLNDDEIVLDFIQNGIVPLRSGLNAWNANGRKRHYNEAYLSITSKIRKEKPYFFPINAETLKPESFVINDEFSKGKPITYKVCQQGGKALMSSSNKDLGDIILRKMLKLKKGEICTVEHLMKVNIRGVKIEKKGLSYYMTSVPFSVETDMAKKISDLMTNIIDNTLTMV
jgi:hypothetical protein